MHAHEYIAVYTWKSVDVEACSDGSIAGDLEVLEEIGHVPNNLRQNESAVDGPYLHRREGDVEFIHLKPPHFLPQC